MLEELERHLDGGKTLEHFEWVVGTSTGGILGLFLCQGYSLKECRDLYFRLKDEVFVGLTPYNENNMNSFLKKEFGEKSMADLEDKPK